MHPIQVQLLALAEDRNLGQLTLRGIGELIGEKEYPQKIKHHLDQLEKKGLIKREPYKKSITVFKQGWTANTGLFSIPILGSVNCGPATSFATQSLEGFLKVSESLLPTKNKASLFALKAVGSSMNRAKVNNKDSIEEGDYVIVDEANKNVKDGEYIVSFIDEGANVKKFINDTINNRILLISESESELPPIVISKNDEYRYLIGGKVIQVIKKPKL